MSSNFAAMAALVRRSHGLFLLGSLLMGMIQTSFAFVLIPSKTFEVKSTMKPRNFYAVDPIARNRESLVVASKSGDEENNEPLFYDDFADFIPGGGDVGGSFPAQNVQESKGNENVGKEEVEDDDEKEEEESELNLLLQKSQIQEIERNERISRNWSQGNWKCRGFSLDKSNYSIDTSAAKKAAATLANSTIAVSEEKSTTSTSSTTKEGPPIHVSQIAFDETSTGGKFGEIAEIIAVGRTDGSVFLVQLGSEYLTKFTAVPKLSWEEQEYGDGTSEGGGSNMRIETELINDKEMQERRASQMSGIQDTDALDIPYLDQDTSSSTSSSMPPFEIQCQFQAHEKNEGISALLYHDDTLYTGCTSGMIKMWRIDEFHDRMQMIPVQNLNIHQDKVVVLKTLSSQCKGNYDVMSHDLLLSASLDGSFALWDKGGDLVYRCQMLDDNGLPTSITAADVDTSGDEHIIYFGLSSGHVVGYVASQLIGHASDGDVCPVPKYRFLAHDPSRQKKNGMSSSSGVTALTFGGAGSVGVPDGARRCSSVLITGGADGLIKQWEMIKQNMDTGDDQGGRDESDSGFWKLQHWPILPTQRMKDRAHIFQGHEMSPITALVCQGGVAPKILSASEDGSLRVWDANKGQENYRMDGFDTVVSSLCLDREVLVTNGMGDYVCVHDFDISEEDEDADFELDLDW